MAGLGQSLKKALFVLVVLLACSTKPVRGFPSNGGGFECGKVNSTTFTVLATGRN